MSMNPVMNMNPSISMNPSIGMNPTMGINQVKKEIPPMDTKTFMDDEDEEVSVAFEELMTEIAKYEGGDKKPAQT